jgi:hypothetical protein
MGMTEPTPRAQSRRAKFFWIGFEPVRKRSSIVEVKPLSLGELSMLLSGQLPVRMPFF